VDGRPAAARLRRRRPQADGNPSEAETVRHIFRRYAVLKSVRSLKDELDENGVISKVRVNRHGRETGGTPIARGALYWMLRNRLYRGEIVHKDQHHPGQHEAIIDEAQWDEVQAALDENRVEHAVRSNAAAPSLLTGLVYDAAGERMSPTHANKKGTRYRYYVSQSLITRDRSKGTASACRVPAADLETIVEDKVCAALRDEAAVYNAASIGAADISAGRTLIEQAANLADRWRRLRPAEKRAILRTFIARITVRSDRVEIWARLATLAVIVTPGLECDPAPVSDDAPATVLSVPARLKRTGMEMKLVIQGDASVAHREPDRSLLRLLGQAQRFHDMVMNGQGKAMGKLAAEAGVNPSYFTRVFRISFLAPDIIQAIVHGRQPHELTANKLRLAGRIPWSWTGQRHLLGFG
jgi:hypothetical protein